MLGQIDFVLGKKSVIFFKIPFLFNDIRRNLIDGLWGF